MTNKKKILILGGSGYLGQYISRRFEASEKYQVCIGDITGTPSSVNCTFIHVDALNKPDLKNAIKSNDIIINCIGQITNPINVCLRINTEGIANIIDSVALYKKKLFHISTVAVYGSKLYVDEQAELNPESPYSACKAFAEFQVISLAMIQNSCILRLPNLYGENQPKGLIAYIKKSLSTDRILQFNNDGSLLRYFLHVQDCAEAIFIAVEKELSGIFNVTAPDKCTIKELIEMIESSESIKFDTNYLPAAPIENIEEICFDKFSMISGFTPQYNIHNYIKHSFHS